MGAQHAVRIEALNSIGKLYNLAYSEMCVFFFFLPIGTHALIIVSENGDQAAIKQFSWIPQSLLQMSQSQEVK
jgi:sister chromatid cohesion protein PDS5